MKAHRKALSILAMALVLALAFFIVPAITDSGQKASAHWPYTLIYYDGHMHTNRSDGEGSVKQIAATAKARGLDAVIITDHCNMLTLAEWNSLVAETAAVSDGSFLALPGFEITGSEGIFNRGHMNAYNVADPFVGDDSLELCPEEVWLDPLNPAGTGANAASLAKWAEYVHSQGGIANHNHTSGSTQLSYGVDNIEVYNQGHVDDVFGYAKLLGYSDEEALGFAITLNDFAIYGERDVNMLVPFPGIPYDIPLRLALYYATLYFPPNIGQWLGSPEAPLNSWDQLLMAYVDGTVAEPVFGVANSDAHNTGDLCYWNEDGSPRADGKGTCCNDKKDDDGDGAIDGEDPECIAAVDKYEPWAQSKVGSAKNGLYVLGLTPSQVYKAIEAGRSFATTGPSLAFDINGQLMGGTAYIPSGGSANVNLSADSESPSAILVKIDIIKNGEVAETINPMAPTYDGTLTETMTERGYYRVEVTSLDMVSGTYNFAWSNPVFVKCPFDDDCDGYINLVERLLGSNPNNSKSTPEHLLIRGTCTDKLDNDKDGLIDRKDPGCR
jgi:hypothetical protein